MPQERSAFFLHITVPELEQTQAGRESDGRHKSAPDKEVDDERRERRDYRLPSKSEEDHDDVVEKCEYKLGISSVGGIASKSLCGVQTMPIGKPSSQSPLLGPPAQ